MGSLHQAGSQGRLHELFVGFPEFVKNRLEEEIKKCIETADGRKARIIDIGAGEVPYHKAFSSFDAESMELVLLDRDESVPADSAKLPPHAWVREDFFDLFPSFDEKPSDSLRKLGGKFDLVIMAAAMHELYYDAVIARDCPTDFHHNLFRFVTEHLAHATGTVLIADYAWPESAFATPHVASHIWRIAEVQRMKEVAGHADPPWAFPSIGMIQRAAHRAGLRLNSSSARGLHDELSDPDLRAAFRRKLSPEEEETLRLRVGYVMTFSHAHLTDKVEQDVKPFLPQAATVALSRGAEDLFRKPGDNRTEDLNRLFVERKVELGDWGPLCHLAGGIREIAKEELRAFTIPDPGIFELWISIGLKNINGKRARYVPELPLQWTEDKAPAKAGVLSSGHSHLISEEGRPFAGRIAIPFNKHFRLESRTLHAWFAILNRLMRDRKGTLEFDLRSIRSLTLFAQDEAAKNCDETARSLCLASKWRDIEEQRRTGHYLVILPRLHDAPADDKPLVAAVNRCLREISKSLLGPAADESHKERANLEEGLPPQYEAFLRSVFYRDWRGDSDQERQEENEKGFEYWWTNKAKAGPPPIYRAYTTIVLGCDGLSASEHSDAGGDRKNQSVTEPDTLMLFLTQAFPPGAIDRITNELHAVCNRLSTLESEILIEAEAGAHAAANERGRQESAKRRAIAGFNHQVGHVIGTKSGLQPLYQFPDELNSGREQLPSPLREDADLRAAQITYAAILPVVFAGAVLPPEPPDQDAALWTPLNKVADLLQSELWQKLLAPLVMRAFPKWHTTFVSASLCPKVEWAISATAEVPGCELVRAVLFELFWNAFRHGLFEPNLTPTVQCAAVEIGDAVQIAIANPCKGDAKTERLDHVNSFVDSMRSWVSARGSRLIDLKFEVYEREWKSVFTLPKHIPS